MDQKNVHKSVLLAFLPYVDFKVHCLLSLLKPTRKIKFLNHFLISETIL